MTILSYIFKDPFMFNVVQKINFKEKLIDISPRVKSIYLNRCREKGISTS